MSRRRDPSRLALERAQESFLAAPAEPLRGVRDLVAESWRRSLTQGVDPAGLAPIPLEDDELAAYRAAHPLAPLMPLVRSLLTQDAEEAGHIVAVGDAAGRLLWVEGHSGLRSRAEGMHFVEGALWSEGGAGTNAPGTALALAAPVQIAAAEHYGIGVHPWSCVASPVRDLRTGEVLGVIDLTGGDDVAGPRSLALVRACAAAMEAQLLTLPVAPAEQSAGGLSGRSAGHPVGLRLQVLGTDTAVLHRAGHRLVLSRRHSEIVLALAVARGGLTAEQLEVALHPDGSHLVTVRAELVRLRRVLEDLPGDDVLGSRPYRLVTPVRTDVDDVRRLLARGALLKALEAFAGPPLPGSQAPAVVSLRAELLGELRQAVLRSRSVTALERWTALPDGHDDGQAWRLLDTCLPYGSPKRAAARAHLARLAG